MSELDKLDEFYDDGKYVRYSPSCRHSVPYSHTCFECEEEAEKYDDMDIDKCLNCGRYKSSAQLDKYQVCKAGCVNPNEY